MVHLLWKFWWNCVLRLVRHNYYYWWSPLSFKILLGKKYIRTRNRRWSYVNWQPIATTQSYIKCQYTNISRHLSWCNKPSMVHLAFFLVFGCFLAAVSHAQYHPYYYDWQHMPYPVNRPQYHYNDDHFQAYPSYEGRTPAAMGGSRIWDFFTTTITLSLSTATV